MEPAPPSAPEAPPPVLQKLPFAARILRRRPLRQLLAISLLGAVSVSAAFALSPSRA